MEHEMVDWLEWRPTQDSNLYVSNYVFNRLEDGDDSGALGSFDASLITAVR